MQPEDIIKQFEVYVDDLTELSTQEEYVLLSKVIQEVCNDRSWEFLRKTGIVSTDTINSAPLPSDFSALMPNYYESYEAPYPDRIVVYANGSPYFLIPAGSQRQKQGNYCYIDLASKRIKFIGNIGVGVALEFDYKLRPEAITSNASVVVLPEEVRYYLAQIMAIDDDIIQKSEKARSNVQMNLMAKGKLLRDLAHINARFINY